MIETVSIVLVFIAYIGFGIKRLMTYMHVLQQEDYDVSRLFKWIKENKAYDKRLTLALLALGAIWIPVQIFWDIPDLFMNFFIFTCLALVTYQEKDPRKNSKKKLVATTRAKRTFWPAYAVIVLIGVPCFYYSHPLLWIINVQAVPFILAITAYALMPLENIIQQSYWNEAHNKVMALKPTVIGVTGSFGKTSVKHILGHILKSKAPTLMTPGSVNTPMGITRIIREQLDETHKYFIVEMGAYDIGSIERLCNLTPPDMGIITAIGHAHYERFKSLENVSRTKYELAEAVLEKDGKVIAHERTLRFPYPRQMRMEDKPNFVICGEPPELDPKKRTDVSYMEQDDLHIQNVQQTKEGLHIKITWQDETHILETPLFGLHHGHNVALAFAAARELGLDAEHIKTSLASLPQISHRLEVKKRPDDVTIIDDAFNSNPLGFRAALDVLSMISEGRKILITPGMIEMGVAHDEAHDKIGQYAAQVCDVAIVVNGKRIPTFVKSFKKTGSGKTLIEVDSFKEASKWVEDNKKPGDMVLIENDLPDMYECIPTM